MKHRNHFESTDLYYINSKQILNLKIPTHRYYYWIHWFKSVRCQFYIFM